MLPGANFNSTGFRDDVRGFRKKNKPLRFFQQYAPHLVVLEIVILLVVVVTMNSSIQHGKQQVATFKQRAEAQQQENRNLLASLQQERQSRTGTENVLREVNSKLASTQRELETLRATSSEQDTHCKSLQESFDRTRLTLEAERDAARLELNMANQRVANLQESVALKDRELNDHSHINAMEHTAKDAHFASKEADWETMRKALESQIRAQGGYVAPSPPPVPGAATQAGGTSQQHPDYAAKIGSGAFHPVQGGRTERFIDTAEDLEQEGVTDPHGRNHLAQLLGHLYDLKVAEYAAMEQSHPGSAATPKPPIGHWMAQTLEGMGVTCKYGVVHLAYILDKHFNLGQQPTMIGRGVQADASSTGGRKDLGGAAGSQEPAESSVEADKLDEKLDLSTPGVVNPEHHEAEAQRREMNAWRMRNQRHHQKVDAAGFV